MTIFKHSLSYQLLYKKLNHVVYTDKKVETF